MDYETTKQDTSCLPEPLTRTNAEGEVYQRQTIVDRQIRDALGLHPEELRRCSEILDSESPDFIKEEALVYLIRHYHKAGDRERMNELSESLLHRCANWIHGQLRSLGDEAATEGYSDVMELLFGRILDLGCDRGDFLQVRFWQALKSLTVQAYRRQVTQLKLDQRNVSLASLAGHDGEDADTLKRRGSVQAPVTVTSRSVESEVIDSILIQDALSQLDEPLRSAFLLRHYAEWPIEDQDPAVRTISRHFGKTPRTIRNWLARAEERLAAWRGTQT